MNLARFRSTWESTRRNNTVLLVSNLLLVIVLLTLSIMLTRRHERIVLVPPYMNTQMEVAWNSANEDYFKSFAMYVALCIGSVTPRTVQFVADAMGAFMAPEIYSKVRAQILSLSNDPTFNTSASTNYFTSEQLVYEASTSRVFVLGKLVTSGFRGTIDEQKPVIYEMRMHIENGRPMIHGFTSYPGTQPHTLKWLKSQPEDVQQKADTTLLDDSVTVLPD
jgi:conjugal transfer pilus assembly protein TraE